MKGYYDDLRKNAKRLDLLDRLYEASKRRSDAVNALIMCEVNNQPEQKPNLRGQEYKAFIEIEEILVELEEMEK